MQNKVFADSRQRKLRNLLKDVEAGGLNKILVATKKKFFTKKWFQNIVRETEDIYKVLKYAER